ncbi:G-protein coupled receptor Mth2-like [Diadema setosum]|uniref:G-protein coupled receptor Mth2-like n=1 Tax=Diadema setosum TaxID=31175 RepID=UPI003B3A08CA
MFPARYKNILRVISGVCYLHALVGGSNAEQQQRVTGVAEVLIWLGNSSVISTEFLDQAKIALGSEIAVDIREIEPLNTPDSTSDTNLTVSFSGILGSVTAIPACLSNELTGGTPTLLLPGDLTWSLLPVQLQLFLRILNGVSLVASIFCIVTYLLFPELRNTHGKNVLSLVFTVAVNQVVAAGYIPLQTSNVPLCIFIATMLYYVVITPNYWWTSVAIYLAWYLGRSGIHRMDEGIGERFFIILSLFGWGVPLILSMLSLIMHVSGLPVYNTAEFCWINQGWPAIMISVQTFTPFAVDCCLFVLVVYRLSKARKNSEKLHEGRNSAKDGAQRWQLTLKMTAVFGVFWVPSWIFYFWFLAVPSVGTAIATQLLGQLVPFALPMVLCCNRRVLRLWRKTLTPLSFRLSSAPHTQLIGGSRGHGNGSQRPDNYKVAVSSVEIELKDCK